MKIIGISGTNGAGKDTVAEMLAKRHGWLFVSVGDILRDELRQRQLPIQRESTRMVSTQMRRQHGNGVIVDRAYEQYGSHNPQPPGLVVSSLRNPDEADRIHRLGGQMVWIDADPKLRYDRIFSRQRSTDDSKTFEQFLAEEEAEMRSQSGDNAGLNMAAVKDKCDIFLQNDTNNPEDLIVKAEAALGL